MRSDWRLKRWHTFWLANASPVLQGWAKGQNPWALHRCSAHCTRKSSCCYRNRVLIHLVYNDDHNDDDSMCLNKITAKRYPEWRFLWFSSVLRCKHWDCTLQYTTTVALYNTLQQLHFQIHDNNIPHNPLQWNLKRQEANLGDLRLGEITLQCILDRSAGVCSSSEQGNETSEFHRAGNFLTTWTTISLSRMYSTMSIISPFNGLKLLRFKLL